jgi:prepilin-type N-terminal cleavage/methylation domain-containing protein
MKSPTKQKTGFTLVELMVVIALIALLAGATIPSMISVFTAGADSQAVNLLSAQLTAARALAMREGKYAAVHVQMGSKYDGTTWIRLNKCYIGLMLEDPLKHVFYPISGYADIQPVPGTMAFGQMDGYVAAADTYGGITDEANLRAFATFDIVFSPSGSLALQKVQIATDHPAFAADPDVGIWNPAEVNSPAGEGDGRESNLSVKSVTVFDFQKVLLLSSGAKMADHLTKEGQYLPINVHTGLLHPRR